jgi:hypothetical protein
MGGGYFVGLSWGGFWTYAGMTHRARIAYVRLANHL